MLQYIIAGLVLGGIYALSSAGLIATYVSTGVMNFAFGSMAYFIARLYYFLYIQEGWSLVAAAVVSIVLAGPAMTTVLYFLLLRHLARRRQLIRVVSMIGLGVAIPELVSVIFGNKLISRAPGLASPTARVYHVFGAAVTTDQLVSYICVVAVLLVGSCLLRFTSIGLIVRGVVDSPAMSRLSGTNPARVEIGVWAVNAFLAGLAGVLSAPVLNISSADNYTLLVAAAFAAVVAARLRSLAVGVIAGLVMGIVTAIVQWKLPSDSRWTTGVVESIPFAFIVISLAYTTIRKGRVGEQESFVGGPLDAALVVARTGGRPGGPKGASPAARRLGEWADRTFGALVVRRAGLVTSGVLGSPALILALLLPIVLSGYQVGLVGQAVAYAMVFLSYTLLTGQAGVISLCQITFAGVGALGTGWLVTNEHWSLGSALVMSALCASLIGVVIGVLTLRMGELYIALVTLAFGLLMFELVFNSSTFVNQGLGVELNRPSFATDDQTFSYLVIGVFCFLALIVAMFQRSTIGLALAAARSSNDGARALGVGVVSVKLVTFGLSAAMAAVGGAFLAMYAGSAQPSSYQAVTGLIWFAVVVTFGVRTVNAALFSGLAFVFIANLVSIYLPLSWAPVPIIAFGLGAVLIAKNPEGNVALLNHQLRTVGSWLLWPLTRRWQPPAAPELSPEPSYENVVAKVASG
jgi:branched-chain amino acid transport system permease protein